MPFVYEYVEKDIALAYKGFTIYHAYDDNIYHNPLCEWYSLGKEDDADEFDIRKLSNYNKNKNHQDILKEAIDLKLIHVEV